MTAHDFVRLRVGQSIYWGDGTRMTKYEIYCDSPRTYAVRTIATHDRCSGRRLTLQQARDAMATLLRADRRWAAETRRRHEATLTWLRGDTD